MSICQGCGADSPRCRVTFGEHGKVKHECPQCSPQTFERIQDPSEKKIWAGYEYMPNMYRKQDDGTYMAKDELRADTEATISKGSTDDAEAYAAAVENKRRHRRTSPLHYDEIQKCLKIAEQIVTTDNQIQAGRHAEAERQWNAPLIEMGQDGTVH